jgi:hypothetical protein
MNPLTRISRFAFARALRRGECNLASGIRMGRMFSIERNLDGPKSASMRLAVSRYVTRRMPREGADH